MALTAAQRTTVRNAYITLGTNQSAYVPAGQTATQWADAQLAMLDEMRAQTIDRSYYTLRVQPFITNRLSLTSTIRTAITNHVNGA